MATVDSVKKTVTFTGTVAERLAERAKHENRSLANMAEELLKVGLSHRTSPSPSVSRSCDPSAVESNSQEKAVSSATGL